MKFSLYSNEFFINSIFPTYSANINRETKRTYCSYIRYICDYNKKDFTEMTEEDVFKYFNHLRNQYFNGEISAKTFCVRLSCCSSLARHIIENYPNISMENYYLKINRPEVSDRIVVNNMPSMQELDSMMSMAKEMDYKIYVALTIAYRVGLNASRIIGIKKENIVQTGNRVYLITSGKRSDQEEIVLPLPCDIGKIIVDFAASVPDTGKGAIFLNQWGKPMSWKNLNDAVKRIGKAAGVGTEYTLRDLRSRAILEFANTNVDKDELCDYVGISGERMRHFLAVGSLLKVCPGELTNYQLKNDIPTKQ